MITDCFGGRTEFHLCGEFDFFGAVAFFARFVVPLAVAFVQLRLFQVKRRNARWHKSTLGLSELIESGISTREVS